MFFRPGMMIKTAYKETQVQLESRKLQCWGVIVLELEANIERLGISVLSFNPFAKGLGGLSSI